MARTAAKHAVIKTRHGSLGTFLVNGSGRTLYLFRKDHRPQEHVLRRLRGGLAARHHA
jgi:hypothetical protein